jgi:hypothetical protein
MSQNNTIYNPSKVIVIDDKENEVTGLLRALSKRDIPFLYFKGRQEELPSTPITGVRIVFLDMKLEGMERQEPVTVASMLMNILKNTISTNNGPFLIFAWTKEPVLLRAFTNQLEERGNDVPYPIYMVNMDKTDCMVDEEIDYSIVSNKLDEKLNELLIFKFFTCWENIVGNSRSEVIGLISSMIDTNDVIAWRSEVNKILYKFAEAQSGENIKNDSLSPTHSTMHVLNSILKDCIEKKVSILKQKYLTTPPENDFSDEIKGLINTKINLRDLKGVKVKAMPGNIYILKSFKEASQYIDFLPKRYYDFLRDFLNINSDRNLEKDILSLLRLSRPCLLEITPLCDYTYNRWKYAKVLVGIIIPRNLNNRMKKKSEKYFQFTSSLYK